MSTEYDPNHFIPEMPETEDDELQYSNRVRYHIANRLLEGDEKIDIRDPKALRSLTTLLKDADGNSLGRKRVQAQMKAADGIGDLATALDNYMRNEMGGRRPFQRHDGDEGAIPPDDVGPKNLSSINIPRKEFIDGQLSASGTEVNIEEIMERGLERRRQLDNEENQDN